MNTTPIIIELNESEDILTNSIGMTFIEESTDWNNKITAVYKLGK